MRFLIDGAEARTGKDVRFVIEAANLTDAQRRANASGIFVASACPAPANRPAFPAPGDGSLHPSALPGRPLFAPWSVGWAAALGTPAAGALVLALNCYRLGRKLTAALVMIAAIALALFMILGADHASRHKPMTFMEFWWPMIEFTLTFALVFRGMATTFQAKAILRHLSQGGELASDWTAGTIGAGCLLIIAAAARCLIVAG